MLRRNFLKGSTALITALVAGVSTTKAAVEQPLPVPETYSSIMDRINYRRLVLKISEDIKTVLYDHWFGFNDPETRRSIASDLNDLLKVYKGERALSDYAIVCDDANNSQPIVDNNEIHVSVYVKPYMSVSFIQINAIGSPKGISFEELVGQL